MYSKRKQKQRILFKSRKH